MDIENTLKSLIKKAVRETAGPEISQGFSEVILDTPKSRKFGDLSTNAALILAQKTGRSPIEIAGELSKSLSAQFKDANLAGMIARIETQPPGFINFFLSQACLYDILLEINRRKDNFGRGKLGQGKKVHLEFVSANPTGPLNIAHGRQAVFGDSLANLLEFSGYRVTREYYLNDEGVQIDILGESVHAKYLGLLGIEAQFPAAGYRGNYIDDLAAGLVQRYGRRFIKGSRKNLAFLAQWSVRKILKKIKEDLSAFGVNYNCWFSQKRLNKSGKIERVLKVLKQKKFLYQKEGAWWLATTQFGDDKDRVVIKSDLKFTYLTPDIAYHQTKFKRGFSKIIDIWGPDHHGYIPRVRAAVCALGYDDRSLSFLIVQLVSLAQADKIIPMSTRQGQYISLADIIQAVGKDVARFFFLMRKRDSHLHFDLELAKKQSLENPVYYVQYAHARSVNILKFARTSQKFRNLLNNDLRLSLLDKPEELSIIGILGRFAAMLESCTLNLEPHRITIYLQELARTFHNYYEKYKVVMQDQPVTQARLVLVNAVRIVLNSGLRLLGVLAPEKM